MHLSRAWKIMFPRHEVIMQRAAIDGLLRSGDTDSAFALLVEAWRTAPTVSTAAFLIPRFEQLRTSGRFLQSRIALLRSFTVEPLIPIFRAAMFASGIDARVHVGDFNTYSIEILESESTLYRYEPNVVILASLASDVAPELWSGTLKMSANYHDSVNRVVGHFADLIAAFRKNSDAYLIIHNLEQPLHASGGLLDGRHACGQRDAIAQINVQLEQIAREQHGVYILDYDQLVARYGHEAWRDERKWITARMPIAAGNLLHVVDEWMRFIHPMTGSIAKVIALDLDNTLWGGVVGEDGRDGLQLGDGYPGAAFTSLQIALLALRARGILLAICSKNNEAEALDAIRHHSGMILRLDHFAARRINWDDKAINIVAIAQELNVGVDSIAFLDDNPVEREHIRHALPQVRVIDLPDNALFYARAVMDDPSFERLTLSDEDRLRSTYYAAERARNELHQTVHTKEDFYRSLEQEALIEPLEAATLPRIAQLTQKTNQFNVTTHRYAEPEIAALAANPKYRIFSIRVKDRFADNGLVGVAITHDTERKCEIDTFLLSCRVIGRTVETALLSHIARESKKRGMESLTGAFIRTAKNAPAEMLYRNHGFALTQENEGGSRWELDLLRQNVEWPPWITRARETVHA